MRGCVCGLEAAVAVCALKFGQERVHLLRFYDVLATSGVPYEELHAICQAMVKRQENLSNAGAPLELPIPRTTNMKALALRAS